MAKLFQKQHRSIQILDKYNSELFVETKEIFKLLDKIGDKKIAEISINGKYRTGKSFILNYFLRYLKYHKKYGENWINGGEETTLEGFDWSDGSEPLTVGIHVWSKPFMITCQDGSEMALLLLDSQGNFDDKTTFQELGVIFSFNLLMSSTIIRNIKDLLRDDDLQFIEYFSMFAESFSSENISGNKSFKSLDKINSIRDQASEAQNTRKEISRIFSHVSSFLMPHPGLKVFEPDFKGQKEMIDKDFIDNVSKFVPLMNLFVPKKIFGQQLTGNKLKAFLQGRAKIINSHSYPEVKTLAAVAANMDYTLALKHSLILYEETMRRCLDTNPSINVFFDQHKIAEDESVKYIKTKSKARISDDSKTEFENDLRERINKLFEGFRDYNNIRIDKELSEAKFSAAMKQQEDIRKKLEEREKECNSVRIDNAIIEERLNAAIKAQESLKISHENEIKEKTIQLENHKRFLDENFKEQNILFQQKTDQNKKLADLEKDVKEKIVLLENQERLMKQNPDLQNSIMQLKSDSIKRIEEIERKIFTSYVKKIHVNYGEKNDEDCLSRNINENYDGEHVYLRPEYTRDKNSAATAFKFESCNNSKSGMKDLAKGAGGLYRYIVTKHDGDRKVNNVWLSDRLEGDGQTTNINDGRLKNENYLYLCWSYE